MANYTIIISAYNRPKSLKNLLDSLNKIIVKKNIKLIISIDNNGTDAVNSIAHNFVWKYGSKEVIIHKSKKGLRNHFIWIGDQTKIYENVLFLEDDLYVSPYMLEFVEKAIEKYSNDKRITGISLYNPLICEFDGCKFFKVEDGYDNYFFQHPYWGNVWFKKQWQEFKNWLKTYNENPSILPKNVQRWNNTSFKKLYVQYMAERNRYIVYPRVAYVTNMGEIGLHNKINLRQYQTILQLESRQLCLSNFDQSNSIYDVFYEYSSELLKKKIVKLKNYNFCVDLRGIRTNYFTEYVLTSRNAVNPVLKYANDFKPQEMNILLDKLGDKIMLVKANDIYKNRNYMTKRLIDDILYVNYDIGLKETVSCVVHLIKKKIGL